MKEIKIQLRHAKIDAPLECTMRVCDDEFFIENENFPPIEIENTRFVPVEERTYAIIRAFLAVHKDEWRDMVTTYGYYDYIPPVYEKIRQNNVRKWQQERLSKQQEQQAMNNNEHTIHYTFDKDGYCTTQCPHNDFLLHVGGKICHQCPHFVSHDYARQRIICNCPTDTSTQDLTQ